MAFLPMTRAEMAEYGWDQCDFVYVCGDAYVDHSSFGCAIISRILEANGYKVGIIAQPDWHDPESIAVLGEPRLAFLVSAGNMDSMVNHYTVAKRRRTKDFYSPGGKMGLRPDNATVVYGNLIRRRFKHVPIVLGGVEASLRRLAHYDYWADKMKRSVLLDSQADLVSYGMGEHSIVAIADALDAGLSVQDITYIPGTAYRTKSLEQVYDFELLPSWEAMQADKLRYAESFRTQYRNLDPFRGKRLVEPYERDGIFVVQNPAAEPLSTEEMDATYALPYERTYHPSYEAAGGVPAISEVRLSITSNRGCIGECSFCSLAFHQGRIIQSRSHESIIEEAKQICADPTFKGYIHDVGGPTANFREPACANQLRHGACTGKRCLSPRPCRSLKVSHADYLELLRKLRALPGVKKVFIRSGIRFDYAMMDKDHTFIEELCKYHVSGQLRTAPEHVSDAVLDVMGKPHNDVYQAFCREFERTNERLGLKQYNLPYLMSSHPGSTMAEAVKLAEFCRDMGFNPEQVSDFYPTPSTISTCIYYTGVDPRTMKEVYCPRSPHEKAMQRALIQYRNPKNYDLVHEALLIAGREDLIGYDEHCLIRPRKQKGKGAQAGSGKQARKGAPAKKANGTKHGKTQGNERRHAGKGDAPDGRRPGANRPDVHPFSHDAKQQRGRGKGAPAPGKGNRRGPIPKATGHKGGISRQGRN